MCPALRRSGLLQHPQSWQLSGDGPDAVRVGYWMWRFDRAEPEVELDNFWGKTPEQAVADMARAGDPRSPAPSGPGELEMMADVYFPSTIAALPPELQGGSPHRRGRHRLVLEGRVEYVRDARLR